MDLIIHPYHSEYKEHCLSLFDLNSPEFFAPNERSDFNNFLNRADDSYLIVLLDGEPVGCFGLSELQSSRQGRISWIMADPNRHGQGIGRSMMDWIISRSIDLSIEELLIAASHISEPFFARFGAERIAYRANGWGEGMHRVDMRLHLPAVTEAGA